jgi:hypothetical protein
VRIRPPPFVRIRLGSRAGPVLYIQTRYSGHVVEVCGDQRCASRQGVGRDRGVEVLDPSSLPLQRRLDASEGLADLIRPARSSELGSHQLETLLQGLLPFGLWKPFDPVGDFRQNGLRHAYIFLARLLEPFYDPSLALHERRHRIRVENELHRFLGGFDFRAWRTEASNSSTAVAVSASILSSCSKNPGDQSDPGVSSLSRARTIRRLRLILRARALRSTASRSGFGMWTLVGMTIPASILQPRRRAEGNRRGEALVGDAPGFDQG